MTSREKIVTAIKNNQPAPVGLPELPVSGNSGEAATIAAQFMTTMESIGGEARIVPGLDSIIPILRAKFPDAGRVISTFPEISGTLAGDQGRGGPHSLADTDLAILRAHFGVAENAAVWITEEAMIERALPFICQHLVVVIDKKDIVANMHEAYDRIASAQYGYGVFIAGPSKTADIEQSLVLGAHGPRSMTVFLLDAGISHANLLY